MNILCIHIIYKSAVKQESLKVYIIHIYIYICIYIEAKEEKRLVRISRGGAKGSGRQLATAACITTFACSSLH